jgi:hypothetical protein
MKPVVRWRSLNAMWWIAKRRDGDVVWVPDQWNSKTSWTISELQLMDWARAAHV